MKKGDIDYSIVGKKFNHLTVISYDHTDSYHTTHWLCECDCGNKTTVSRNHLVTGHTTSCGCRQHARLDDLVGKRFGRLHVLNFEEMRGRSRSYWRCICDCGKEVVVRRDGLTSGAVISCGCYNTDRLRETNTIHNLCGSEVYRVWVDMRRRCNCENDRSYHNYGGRGITVCDEWNEYANFYRWTMSHGYEPGLSIDRIDNDGGYSPSNCRWANRVVQQNNRRTNRRVTYNDITNTVANWARLFGINANTLRDRILRNDMRDFEKYFGDTEKKEGYLY